MLILLFASCGDSGRESSPAAGSMSIEISGDGIEGVLTFTLAELMALPDAVYEHVYSTINNWPTERFCVAKGIRAEALLSAAGVLADMQSVTFRSHDSYEVTLTREQLLDVRYYFPGVAERDPEGAIPVPPIIAYELKEGTDDMTAMQPDDFSLIFGQSNIQDHTNPAFVKNLKEIIISNTAPEQWVPASVFPVSGIIPSGDSIKLQHPDFGLVKMFYTLDGSDPTELSTMYNPSTYQPELNKPIVFTEDAALKVIVTGFGRKASGITIFEIKVQ